MRPGLAFVGLFAALLLTYVLLRDSLGTLTTFLLQFGLVIALLGGATWYRYSKHRKGWFFFGEDEAEEEDDNDDQQHHDTDADAGIRKAS